MNLSSLKNNLHVVTCAAGHVRLAAGTEVWDFQRGEVVAGRRDVKGAAGRDVPPVVAVGWGGPDRPVVATTDGMC